MEERIWTTTRHYERSHKSQKMYINDFFCSSSTLSTILAFLRPNQQFLLISQLSKAPLPLLLLPLIVLLSSITRVLSLALVVTARTLPEDICYQGEGKRQMKKRIIIHRNEGRETTQKPRSWDIRVSFSKRSELSFSYGILRAARCLIGQSAPRVCISCGCALESSDINIGFHYV